MPLTKEQALARGKAVNVEYKLDGGVEGACSHNTFERVKERQHEDARYCVGYAAGSDERYLSHVWAKIDNNYAECSPQRGMLRYVLVQEMTVDEVHTEALGVGAIIGREWLPPLLGENGVFYCLPRDID